MLQKLLRLVIMHTENIRILLILTKKQLHSVDICFQRFRIGQRCFYLCLTFRETALRHFLREKEVALYIPFQKQQPLRNILKLIICCTVYFILFAIFTFTQHFTDTLRRLFPCDMSVFAFRESGIADRCCNTVFIKPRCHEGSAAVIRRRILVSTTACAELPAEKFRILSSRLVLLKPSYNALD